MTARERKRTRQQSRKEYRSSHETPRIMHPVQLDRPASELDLTKISDLRALLFAHNMRPNKSFGQNFLIDRPSLEKIVEAAELQVEDQVLEVGSGTGVLTRELAIHARRVIAVELERDMLALLESTIGQYSNIEVVAKNLLYLDPTDLYGQEPYKLVANLPYYITAPTFRHFLESANPPRTMVVMVQKEVAQRICAQPGDLSVLAISIQLYGTPEIVDYVPAQAFYPAPKVDSAIMRVRYQPRVELTWKEQERFFKVVQAGFAEKRKQLHNSLTHELHIKNEDIRSLLQQVGIEASRRAETVSIEEWLQLTRAVEAYRVGS